LINSNPARIAFKALIGQAPSPAATLVTQHPQIAKPIFDAGIRSVALALRLPNLQAAGIAFYLQLKQFSTFTNRRSAK
jgi:hypothetical protein